MSTSALRQLLDETTAAEGCTMKALTVLSDQVDPFRLDTPTNHTEARWLAGTLAELGLLAGNRKLHERGAHYAIAFAPEAIYKPDGTRYLNNDDNWKWIGGAFKAARWLGYIDFERISDKRNDAPVVRIFEPKRPWSYLSVGVRVDIPSSADIEPIVGLGDFQGTQPYKLVMIGEKSSLDEVLAPIAERYQADLYLPTGNISDTLVHQIAKIGAADGRPMVVCYFADFDPSGWNMAIEVGRKLQAFKASLFPDLEFRQYRAALTPEQVREHGLPSAPLKDTERRADKWREAWGIEQTEIDAAIVLRPDLLREIAAASLAPFFDRTLANRVYRAKAAWIEEAQAVVDGMTDHDHLDQLRDEASEKLATLRAEIDAINEAARIDTAGLDLPAIPDVPDPIVDEDQPVPLVDSGWSFAAQCQALRESKAYHPNGNGGAS